MLNPNGIPLFDIAPVESAGDGEVVIDDSRDLQSIPTEKIFNRSLKNNLD